MPETIEQRFEVKFNLIENEYGWWCEHEVIPSDVSEGWGESPQEAVIAFMEGLLHMPQALYPLDYQSLTSKVKTDG